MSGLVGVLVASAIVLAGGGHAHAEETASHAFATHYDFERFRCGPLPGKARRSCLDMESCEEATFHWAFCGRDDFDRDQDGMPCEGVCPKVDVCKRR